MRYVAHKDYNPDKHSKATKLDWRHYRAIEMRFQKKNYKEIAEEVGVSTETIRHWVMLKTFKEEEQKFRSSVRVRVKQRLLNMSEKALDTLEQGLNGDIKSGVNVKCAELIMKYAGLEPAKDINLQADITATQLSLEEKKQLLLSKLAGEVIDDDSEEDNDVINEDDVIDVEYEESDVDVD